MKEINLLSRKGNFVVAVFIELALMPEIVKWNNRFFVQKDGQYIETIPFMAPPSDTEPGCDSCG